MANTDSALNPSREDFAALLEQSFMDSDMQEGSVIKPILIM